MTNKKPRRYQHRGRREDKMKRINGVWWYKGKAYTTMRAALEAAWPKK